MNAESAKISRVLPTLYYNVSSEVKLHVLAMWSTGQVILCLTNIRGFPHHCAFGTRVSSVWLSLPRKCSISHFHEDIECLAFKICADVNNQVCSCIKWILYLWAYIWLLADKSSIRLVITYKIHITTEARYSVRGPGMEESIGKGRKQRGDGENKGSVLGIFPNTSTLLTPKISIKLNHKRQN